MKVLLFNGSPHKEGCTYTALKYFAETLKEEDIDSYIYHVGNDAITSCKGCRACAQIGRCVIDDKVNEFVDLASDFDGYVIGSPVHYASASGATVAFLDRAFYSASASGRASVFNHKPGTVIVSARRGGTTATFDQLNKYFTINQMPVISGRYWNMVHGNTPDEVKQDLEGMQNVEVVARNMAWFLKCKDLAIKSGLSLPSSVVPVRTNFIR